MKATDIQKIIIACLFTSLFMSCSKDLSLEDKSKIKSSVVMESPSEHLAFPDLIWNNGFWYITFRQADSHINSTYSKIIVMKSFDFKNWENYKSYEYPSFDLRDPKFSYNEDSLFLHFYASASPSFNTNVRKNIYINLTNKNDNKINLLADNSIKVLKLPAQYSNDWLWRPIWVKGKLVVAGYKNNQARLYEYDNILSQPNLLYNLYDGTTETTMREYKNDLLLFSRKKDGGILGTFSSTFKELGWKNIFNMEIGGPNFIVRNDTIYFAGRVNSSTSIYSYSVETGNLNFFNEFSSKIPDCGYPGLFLKDDKIYGVYYTVSLDNGFFQIRTFTF